MGNRQAIHRVLTLVGSAAAVLTLSAAVAAPAHDAVELRPRVAAVQESNAEFTLTWVFRDEDLFACETVAYDLRRLIGEFGGRLDVRAIGVATDDELVDSFLHKHRLAVRVTPSTAAQYRQAFGTTQSPAVFITRAGQPVRSLFVSRTPQAAQQSTLELYEVVSHLLTRPAHTVARAQ